MSFLFNIPDSLKKVKDEAENRPAAPKRTVRMRPTMSYADLDDPNGAPERPRRQNFSLRRAANGALVPPKPPPTRGGIAPRGILTRVGRIPAGAKNPYTLKRNGPGKPDVPERRLTPVEEDGEIVDQGRPSTSTGLSIGNGDPISLFAGKSSSPSRHTRRDESPHPPPLPTRAEKSDRGGGGMERERNNARTLTAHNLTGLTTISDVGRSLRALIGRECRGTFDRYQLLDERDKLLCKLREISPSLFSKNGSCPDMCPEKERYVRVVQMRVADYETDGVGDMDPRRMVKEYSRSAADQEEPLEHEMRPANVMINTMDYLLTEIVDAMPAVGADAAKWYDFLWNRTRAIRKELTQQMMSNETAVKLIECCTRVHMFAAFSLDRLPREDFDGKMNDENMGKCLQSLRHLYEDLAKKEIFCESEAEFRAYDVMLHLNDSNILRQVLSYRREVRESAPVRLALKLFSALQSDNYIRFFRLLREQATFLQCCVVYRYFGKMRLTAFTTIAAAYTKKSALPMSMICEQLAFDDEEQTIEVAASYHLSFTREPGFSALIPDSRAFNAEAGEIVVPCEWIEKKREGRLLSEIFRGAPSSSSPTVRSPIDSFDDNGVYRLDPVLDEYLAKIGTGTDSVRSYASAAASALDVPKAEAVAKPFGSSAFSKPFGGLSAAALAAPAAPPTGTISFGGGPSAFGRGAAAAEGFSFGKSSSTTGAAAPSGFGAFLKKSLAAPTAVEALPATRIQRALTDEDRKREEARRKNEANAVAWSKDMMEKVVEESVDESVRECAAAERLRAQEAETARIEEEKRQAEKERKNREQRERAKREADEREREAKVEKKRRSQLVRLQTYSESIFKHICWPLLLKEIDAAILAHARDELALDQRRMEDGIARYKSRMHALWLRQFTDQWKAYAKWKKEERDRCRRIMSAVVSRNPVGGLSSKLKRRLLTPQPDDVIAESKRSRGPYAHLSPMTALAVVNFEQRRRRRIMITVVDHWRCWAERRAIRRLHSSWPRQSQWKAPRMRPPTPTIDSNGSVVQGSEERHSSPSVERKEKRQKSRRSVGIYSFLSADDSFLAEPATPAAERRGHADDSLRSIRAHKNDVLNSTALSQTGQIGFNTFMEGEMMERSCLSESDLAYARNMMEQSQWRLGGGAVVRARRILKEKNDRKDDYRSPRGQPLPVPTEPSWKGLFDALNEDARDRHEREAWKVVSTAEPLNSREVGARKTATAGSPSVSGVADLTLITGPEAPPLPWQREEMEKNELAESNRALTQRLLEETRRMRADAEADKARMAALLARYEV